MWLTFTAFVPLMWSLFADTPIADQPSTPPSVYKTPPTSADRIGKFQFARLRYPGGIPGFIKNWYTDYPEMDYHLATIVRRLTGIDSGPSVVVDPSSQNIFEYPLVYSVEPEQMVL